MPSLDIDALTPTNTKSALTLVKTLPSPPHITNGHIVRHAQAVRNSRKVAMPPAASVRLFVSVSCFPRSEIDGRGVLRNTYDEETKRAGGGGRERDARECTMYHLQRSDSTL